MAAAADFGYTTNRKEHKEAEPVLRIAAVVVRLESAGIVVEIGRVGMAVGVTASGNAEFAIGIAVGLAGSFDESLGLAGIDSGGRVDRVGSPACTGTVGGFESKAQRLACY